MTSDGCSRLLPAAQRQPRLVLSLSLFLSSTRMFCVEQNQIPLNKPSLIPLAERCCNLNPSALYPLLALYCGCTSERFLYVSSPSSILIQSAAEYPPVNSSSLPLLLSFSFLPFLSFLPTDRKMYLSLMGRQVALMHAVGGPHQLPFRCALPQCRFLSLSCISIFALPPQSPMVNPRYLFHSILFLQGSMKAPRAFCGHCMHSFSTAHRHFVHYRRVISCSNGYMPSACHSSPQAGDVGTMSTTRIPMWIMFWDISTRSSR